MVDAILSKTLSGPIRLCACSPSGRHSGTWMAIGSRSDYYIGARSIFGSMKISLHASGICRVAMTDHQSKFLIEQGLMQPEDDRAFLKWRRTDTKETGAVHVVSLIFPIAHMHHEAALGSAKKPLFKFEAPDDPAKAVEFGFFFSRVPPEELEQKLVRIGMPLFWTGLDNGETVSIVVRVSSFDPAILPRTENLNKSQVRILSVDAIPEFGGQRSDLTAALWNKPKDGESLQIIEVGGVTLRTSTK